MLENRGDIEAMMALFTNDAVREDGSCQPPCVRITAVRKSVQTNIDEHFQANIISAEGAGDTVTARAEISSDAFRARDIEKRVTSYTVKLRDGKITAAEGSRKQKITGATSQSSRKFAARGFPVFRSASTCVSTSIDLAPIRNRSVVRHQLVHHLHVVNNIKLPCRSASDAQAYGLQAQWLNDQKVPEVYTLLGMNEQQIGDLEECPF
jgi:SnoaL-like protein